jgi:tRNA A37 threonylcarbamoyladenosine synthetase subunit TsaC/SUA5/YrdC
MGQLAVPKNLQAGSHRPSDGLDSGMQSDAMRAYERLREGGVVLLPTDVGYGLVAIGEEAVARIYALKGRPHAKPCVTVANAAILDDVATIGCHSTRAWVTQIAARTPIAVITDVRADSVLLGRLHPFVHGQATTDGTIATFVNAGPLVVEIAELAHADGRLVVGSSANVAFTGNNYRLEDVPASIRDHVDLVIPGGPARYRNEQRLATTILDLRTGTFVRVGIHHAMIEASWRAHQDARGGEPGLASLM